MSEKPLEKAEKEVLRDKSTEELMESFGIRSVKDALRFLAIMADRGELGQFVEVRGKEVRIEEAINAMLEKLDADKEKRETEADELFE